MNTVKRFSFVFYVAIAFIALSAITYFIHYLIFHDIHHIFIYMVGDLAFLPIEVLLVVIILERLLANREKHSKLKKLNMVVGAFFIEVGNHLLRDILQHTNNRAEISQNLNITASWTKKDFHKAAAYAHKLDIDLDYRAVNIGELREFLNQKREFLLALLANPNILEHDRFTDLLWATTHLDEELEARASISELPATDLEHIAGDIKRLYDHLTSEWVSYAEHLKENYPFLFSLVLRTHPFQENQSAILT